MWKKASRWIITGLAVALVIAIFMLLRECEGNKTNITSDGDTIVHHTVDSVLVKGDTDTVYIDTTIYVPTYVYNTVVDTVMVMVNDTNRLAYEYTTPYEDSLISGNVITKVQTDGTLIDQGIYYTPKFPKFVYRTDTLKIYDSTIIETNYPSIVVGGQLSGGQNSFGIMPTIGYKTKTGLTIYGGYDFMNKTVGVGALYDIKLKNKRKWRRKKD